MAVPGALTTKTVTVPHLTGSKIGYYLPKPVVGSKPTLIMINPVLASANFYKKQFEDPELADKLNLVAFEPLAHGSSSTKNTQYTLWNSAIAFVQVMDALGIKSAIVLGTSVGGAVAARMALHAPGRVLGLIPVCTTFNSGPRVIELGSTDLDATLINILKQTASIDESFSVPDELASSLPPLWFGSSGYEAESKSVAESIKKAYAGEVGRLRFRQAIIGLVSRDSLHLRLDAITQPILWIRGSGDDVFAEAVVKEDISLLKNADVKLETIQGAYHAPTWTHTAQVNPLILDFVRKHSGVKDARALREAVGMIDM